MADGESSKKECVFSKYPFILWFTCQVSILTLTPPRAEAPPPTYTENAAIEPDASFIPPDIKGLDDAKDPSNPANPSVAQCLAHLKLLWAFHRLRKDISASEDLPVA